LERRWRVNQIVFNAFFQTATGNSPYEYQIRLACGEAASLDKPETLTKGTECASRLINIPTGLGKTAAVVLAWLWNRVGQPDKNSREKWPRRLVYCLPMRTLVEQTEENVITWLKNLWEKRDTLRLDDSVVENLKWLSGDAGEKQPSHSPVILMGGEDLDNSKREWDIYPERPCILIGTQDMLLSRALNRGYGMSRARWPMHFGLLNNDTLWVFDETQLMGVAVRTSAQLEGLRGKLGVAAGCKTWWGSATLDTRLLETIDHPVKPGEIALGESDLASSSVTSRVNAVKRLSSLPLKLSADSAKMRTPYIEALAQTLTQKHVSGSTTLVILNRVNRAQELFAALESLAKKNSLPERILVHSRFRPMEREKLSVRIKGSNEKIIIATQAIEAGVDLTSRTLITELAPWSSLVQRFGRCNRHGELNDTDGADIFWVDLASEDEKAASALALPYTPEQLATARQILQMLQPKGASPSILRTVHPEEPLPHSHIIRRKDLIDLFDTTPDLAGLDLDIGRYIRDDEDRDVQAFWREIPQRGPDTEIDPLRDELVRVPLEAFKKLFEKNRQRVWVWDALEGLWTKPERISPTQVYLVAAEAGGYSEKLGWTGEKSKNSFPLRTRDEQPKVPTPRDGQDTDEESRRDKPSDESAFQSIEEHTDMVATVCKDIVASLPASSQWRDTLLMAVQWHDVGKAHATFQEFITRNQTIPARLQNSFIAKAPFRPGHRHVRPHFRHELASALAWLDVAPKIDPSEENLIAYLIACHHGKVRLSIRALPGENVPPEKQRFARGIWDGEQLPGDVSRKLKIVGFPATPISLDLSCMEIGITSWAARCAQLRDRSSPGVFGLAWLETLLRAADARGSQL
jgi:CRISPR-associated endonuclease/helicase Cas3